METHLLILFIHGWGSFASKSAVPFLIEVAVRYCSTAEVQLRAAACSQSLIAAKTAHIPCHENSENSSENNHSWGPIHHATNCQIYLDLSQIIRNFSKYIFLVSKVHLEIVTHGGGWGWLLVATCLASSHIMVIFLSLVQSMDKCFALTRKSVEKENDIIWVINNEF